MLVLLTGTDLALVRRRVGQQHSCVTRSGQNEHHLALNS